LTESKAPECGTNVSENFIFRGMLSQKGVAAHLLRRITKE
jgi:hypothetical protein